MEIEYLIFILIKKLVNKKLFLNDQKDEHVGIDFVFLFFLIIRFSSSAPPVEKSIGENDFEKLIDPNTGKEFYRLTDEALHRKGLTDVKAIEFDLEIDSTTGQTIMKPKVNIINGQKVEVIIDSTTGEQTIRMGQEKPSENCKIKKIFLLFFFNFFFSGNNNNNN
jgi:hypothetical protein